MIRSVLALLVLTVSVQAATVTNYITDAHGDPIKTRVVFTPFTPTTVFGSTNVLGPSVGFDAIHGAWSARVLPGWFFVDESHNVPPIRIFVPFGDDTTNSLAYYAILATNPIPTFGYSLTISSNINVTNIFATNIFAENGFFSNLFATNIVAQQIWTSNLFATNVVALEGYFSNLFSTNLVTQNLTVSNLVAQFGTISNLYAQFATISNLTAQFAYISNLYVGTMWLSNNIYVKCWDWPGPTNTLDMLHADNYYASLVPVKVTGLTDKSDNGWSVASQLSISNAASSNIFMTLDASFASTGNRIFTITNGQEKVFWFKYRDFNGKRTNVIEQEFGAP
jgi:hypothetical protein